MTYLQVSEQANSDCTLGPAAPVRRLFDSIGDKWALLALYALAEGPTRFNALQRRLIGVSPKVLSETLKRLAKDGFIARSAFAETPPRVEYALSPMGLSLVPVLDALCQWSRSHTVELGARTGT